MATNEDYRDFVYMNQQRNIMNKLNDMGAPSVSTIINVIEKVGGRYQQQANIILENAVRSKDPVIMSEAKEQILALQDKAPAPFKGVIGATANSLDVYSDISQSNESFTESLNNIQTKWSALPKYEKTKGGPELQKELTQLILNANENKIESGIVKEAIAQRTLQQEQMTSLQLLSEWDADPSTPDVMDMPEKFEDDIQKSLYDTAHQTKALYDIGDYSTATSELIKLRGKDLTLDKALWSYNNKLDLLQDKIDRDTEKGRLKTAAKIAGLKNKEKLTTLGVLKGGFDDKLKLYAEHGIPPEIAEASGLNDPAEAALWSTLQNSLFKPSQGADGNIKNPHFHPDEFMKYISGVNPYSEEGSAIQADYKMPGYVDAELGIAKENKRVAAEIDEIRLSLGTIKGSLEEARDYQAIDNDELEVAISSIGESMMGTGKDAIRNVPLQQVISNIDKAIITMIEDRDSSFMPDWLGGWQAPTTTVPTFDVWNRDPLTETHKLDMDSIIEANRSKLSSDKKFSNTYGSLNKARDEAYRLLMSQLMSQKFQIDGEDTLDDMPAPE